VQNSIKTVTDIKEAVLILNTNSESVNSDKKQGLTRIMGYQCFLTLCSA